MASHAFSLGGGTAIGQLALIAASPILTRLFSQEEFGAFGLFSSFLAVAAVVACLRLDMAIVSARTERQAAALLMQCVFLIPVVAMLSGVSIRVMQRNEWLAFETLPALAAPTMVIAVVVTGLFGALRFWNAREMQFRQIGQAVLRQSLGRAGAPMALGLAGAGWDGLVGGEIIGRSLGILHLGRPAVRKCSRLLVRCGGRYHRLVALRNWKFPSILMPSSLLDAVAGSLPLPLIAASFGPAAAGSYALITRLASVPGALIAASLADVFQSHLARDLFTDGNSARRQVIKTARMLLLVALAIFVPAALLGPTLIPLIFGSGWREAGIFLAILAPNLAVALVVSPLSRAIVVANRQELKLIIDCALLLAPILTLYVLRDHGLHYALVAFSIVNVAVYAVYFFLILYAIGHPARILHQGTESD